MAVSLKEGRWFVCPESGEAGHRSGAGRGEQEPRHWARWSDGGDLGFSGRHGKSLEVLNRRMT